jgi:hypothetical protein
MALSFQETKFPAIDGLALTPEAPFTGLISKSGIDPANQVVSFLSAASASSS